jgi:hypothetical protein
MYVSYERPEKKMRALGSAVWTASAAAVMWVYHVYQSTGSAAFAPLNSFRKPTEAKFGQFSLAWVLSVRGYGGFGKQTYVLGHES